MWPPIIFVGICRVKLQDTLDEECISNSSFLYKVVVWNLWYDLWAYNWTELKRQSCMAKASNYLKIVSEDRHSYIIFVSRQLIGMKLWWLALFHTFLFLLLLIYLLQILRFWKVVYKYVEYRRYQVSGSVKSKKKI